MQQRARTVSYFGQKVRSTRRNITSGNSQNMTINNIALDMIQDTIKNSIYYILYTMYIPFFLVLFA